MEQLEPRRRDTGADKDDKLRHAVEDDVKQMLMVKEEAPEDHRSVAELHDPKPRQIKEEEEEVCISLGGEQLNKMEEIDVTPIKSEEEIQSIPLSQSLYEDLIKERDLPEENDEGESIKTENHEDGSVLSEIEVVVKDEEDDDVSELNHLPDSGLETKDEDKDWMESGDPEADGNIFSEFAEQFLHNHSIQKRMAHSDMRSAASMDNNKCFTEKETERKVHAGDTFSCEDCGKTFVRKYNFNRHKRIHTEQKSFCCELCEERFNRKSSLNLHMRIHTEYKPFCCDLCGQGLRHKRSLNAHMRIHTKQKPFSCELCEQRFNRKSSLNTHMRIHTGHKPFCCDLCGQSFRHKSNLSTHVRSHTRQQPFCCDICGQRLRYKSSLSIHMSIHAGQRPFCCDLCGQRFVNTSHLNSHKRIHTGLKPFCCDVCGKRFAHKPHLSAHARVHTGQKPFCCDLCGRKFSERGKLKRHMRIHN
ncbi:zinc finger protein 664-like isoform X2 [Poeciliopsis prolifica]|uniref:zinc finger protein 664-like isoform X2 n=1 Tax=Poeciliopsis prolifica TaxID=188132 RepID=UPI0024139C69|nr:zinc finger protein 664-like isoform X2 [Poeciliopsis prolifica]